MVRRKARPMVMKRHSKYVAEEVLKGPQIPSGSFQEEEFSGIFFYVHGSVHRELMSIIVVCILLGISPASEV